MISIILVLFVLPQILLFGDWIIEKTALTINLSRYNTREMGGKMVVNGHVKGYIEGEIDAEIKGNFQGKMEAALETKWPGKQGSIEIEEGGRTE